jgi:hypothetical protein
MSERVLVGYVRVSTAQQGRSDLGIEARRAAIALFAGLRGRPGVRGSGDREGGRRPRPPPAALRRTARGSPSTAAAQWWSPSWTASAVRYTSSRA